MNKIPTVLEQTLLTLKDMYKAIQDPKTLEEIKRLEKEIEKEKRR